ncbi:unnamed protein product [Adineta steineri]|uniref:Uncharacterized protein n=1 Tax=Adineta steineri TaxID=433720 RepID=A0A814AZW7_9BILA|nr:unnamed protein product [Adineta steineri]CAF0919683.1 unnamed protein product [Adineta steineri]
MQLFTKEFITISITFIPSHLFIVSLYILCYIAIVKPESQTITKYNITRAVFNQLDREHADTLSCSCSKVEVPLKAFVSYETIFHPVCNSIFVNQQWIQTLYFENASRYGTGDFRTTAYSQVSAFLTILLFTSLSTKIATTRVIHPSLTTYKNLEIQHSETLRCPCSNMIISHGTFITLSPVVHQICSSDFVTDEWLSIMQNDKRRLDSLDWRNKAFSKFSLLSNLCRLANKTISDAIHRFLLQPFIASNALSESDFDLQLNAILDRFFQSTILYFGLLLETERILTQVDQPYIGSDISPFQPSDPDENVIGDFTKNVTNNKYTAKLLFKLAGPRGTDPTSTGCICAVDIYCQVPAFVFYLVTGVGPVYYNVSGSVVACSATNSLMLSTLECYYNDSDCFSILMSSIKDYYIFNNVHELQFIVRPLVYNSTSSRFPPNTSISKIIKNMTVEQWNPSYSYNRFYNSCAPSFCTYSKQIRIKTIVEVIIAMISMIGGLILALRLITPLLLRDFGSNVDHLTAKRLGQWATRLYIILFLVTLISIMFYNIGQETYTKTFDKPSMNWTKQLYIQYGDELKCPCSSIASTYERFVKIKPVFHEICSSPFASEEGRANLTANLIYYFSFYSLKDYRRFLSAHLQFLQGLCELSNQATNISIQGFLSSLFSTTEILSEENFHTLLNSIIKQNELNPSTTITDLLFVIRNIYHGNAIISLYGTNFEYIAPWDDIIDTYLPTQALIYDDECSCGLHLNCTTQATFINIIPSKSISIKGLKIGCTPSESFRASTLECFYNQSCIDLVQQITNQPSRINLTNSLKSLSTNKSRFSINTTIGELINNLFIEQWNTTINYTSYFERCLPLLCSYTYIQQSSFLSIMTHLLTLQGGLAILLRWICPKIVQIVFKVYRYRKRRINTIQPADLADTGTIENINTITQSSPSNSEVTTTATTTPPNSVLSTRYILKIALICVLLLCVIIALIIFSIVIAQRNKNQACQLKIQPITIERQWLLESIDDHAIADFNGDDRLDIAFMDSERSSMNVLLGNGNATFGARIISLKNQTHDLRKLYVSDFNNDRKLDLAAINPNKDYIAVFFGNGDGNFEIKTKLDLRTNYRPLAMTIADFNNDNYSDIAVIVPTSSSIHVFLGKGNGDFLEYPLLDLMPRSYPVKLVVADFNCDNRQDIAVVSQVAKTIDVFIGRGDGRFEMEKTSFAGDGEHRLIDLAVGDFNKDNIPDVIVSYHSINHTNVIFGYGNGTLGNKKRFTIGDYSETNQMVVRDFNNDQYLDIGFGREGKSLNVLLGSGDGNFELQTAFQIRFITGNIWIGTGDFNGDGHEDIICANDMDRLYDVLLLTCE